MNMTTDQILATARKIREFIATNAVTLDDEQAAEIPYAFPAWMPGVTYMRGSRVRYGEKVYKCLQEHTSYTDWTPTGAASMWAQVLTATEDGKIPEWQQPDSTNGYSVGDRVLYDGIVYVSLIDNNVWSPAGYPAGWRAE